MPRLIPELTYARKLFLLATLPLLMAVSAIAVLVADQSRNMADHEISELEAQLISAKRQELQNYLQLARAAITAEYNPAPPDDEEAKLKVTQILSAMTYGIDGYFFVYDYDGTNLVAPRDTRLITQNWTGLADSIGTPVVDELITLAQQGGGYHSYLWPKPSTGKEAQMISYVVGLQDWQWAIGTGVFIDDVLTSVAAARAEVEARIRRTFVYIGAITMAATLLVFMSGVTITIRERRLADAKLKELTQRIFDTQEEERGRVARELHDGISQILVGVRYALELARRQLAKDDPNAPVSLDRGVEMLGGAITEVRRISRDLRPGVLDDLGLGPALKALTEEFQTRTGIKTELETVVFRNRLDEEARIALFRIAQEALTNIERHAEATEVTIKLAGHRTGATLLISDDGRGFDMAERAKAGRGLGLRNMAERMEQLGGTLTIYSLSPGTAIDATVPLKHILTPAGSSRPPAPVGSAR
ncbi:MULTISPECIES: cache domain-containing protein [Roseobacteraceae]|uniref:Integral membrane sensor signal transduction histidine kinase n=1 Tax=Celeribacter baekdonensis B30 TaxID=1208323 RepID=K2INQ8_9RHOB|nr:MULTISPECIES: cache domain-containing protein [Roseobacteraceae]MBU0642583.1 cache domain-containing protein [Alphaproteobacteria bacterium]EKE71781.1 integral membrane sensor signal transduction histidine kinase [Celeribacter baekdonensis B30]KAB6715129.1 histidine kinase [Roseobacter sp. TSBP12]MBU1278674.1 cache domain-containing protein [Alphaproteobacteria bacterium]MBU1575103.1 cache domain-containing protein [Alphaproteobacteria bacterium]